MSKLIYLDNAATTQVYPEVLQEMLPYFSEVYSNPSAIYSFASESKKAVDKARTSVAELINAKTDEIYFTGGGSESDNWALKATADAYASKGKHIITSTIEHHAILHTCAYLEKKGFEITYVNVDMLSASGHKINGPKGIGVMYIRKGVKILSFIHGGAQERKRRAGTLNVPGIVGIGKAAEIAKNTMAERSAKEISLRDHLIDRILTEIPYVRLNGDRHDRLPNNVNVCFRYIEGESMLILLDQAGVCASSGSACTSGSLDPSHVLLAIGLPHEIAHGSLRLTLSEKNTVEEIDFVVTSSMATELVKGKTVQQALEVTNKAVMEALDGLPPVKVHCSLLAEEAIHAALWDYAEKNHITIEGLEKPVNDISEKEEGEEEEY